MSETIRVGIASDREHEKVFAEVYRNDKFVATVSQDDDNLLVELPGPNLDEACVSRTIPLKDLQEALVLAQSLLTED